MAEAGWRNENHSLTPTDFKVIIDEWQRLHASLPAPGIANERWVVAHVPFITREYADKLRALGGGVSVLGGEQERWSRHFSGRPEPGLAVAWRNVAQVCVLRDALAWFECQVISVMHGNRLAMVFVPGKVPAPPPSWKARLAAQAGTPGTQRYRLTVNGAVCSEGVAARRAAPDVARALAELKFVLAATQYRVWKDSPRDLQHDCDLANQVWESGATLKLGLPLEEREFSGKTRQFESESTAPFRPELFRVPDGYAAIDAPS